MTHGYVKGAYEEKTGMSICILRASVWQSDAAIRMKSEVDGVCIGIGPGGLRVIADWMRNRDL